MFILANAENKAVIGLDSSEYDAWEKIGRHETIYRSEISVS